MRLDPDLYSFWTFQRPAATQVRFLKSKTNPAVQPSTRQKPLTKIEKRDERQSRGRNEADDDEHSEIRLRARTTGDVGDTGKGRAVDTTED